MIFHARAMSGHLELPHLVPKHASRHPECKARIWDVLLVPSRLAQHLDVTTFPGLSLLLLFLPKVTCRSHHLGESVLCHQWACHLPDAQFEST